MRLSDAVLISAEFSGSEFFNSHKRSVSRLYGVRRRLPTLGINVSNMNPKKAWVELGIANRTGAVAGRNVGRERHTERNGSFPSPWLNFMETVWKTKC